MDGSQISSADDHYFEYKEKCTCGSNCLYEGMIELSRQFYCRNEVECINIVRMMLLPLTAGLGEKNELLTAPRTRKQKETDSEEESTPQETQYASVRYAMAGRKLCAYGFCEIVQLWRQAINRNSRDLGSNLSIASYETDRGKHRKDKTSIQTKIVKVFLQRYAELYGFPCPRGRLYTDSEPVRYLPSGTTRRTVYKKYAEDWNMLKDSAIEIEEHLEVPEKPLVGDSFGRVWRQNYPNLNLSCGGTDFCDTCISKTRKIKTLEGKGWNS